MQTFDEWFEEKYKDRVIWSGWALAKDTFEGGKRAVLAEHSGEAVAYFWRHDAQHEHGVAKGYQELTRHRPNPDHHDNIREITPLYSHPQPAPAVPEVWRDMVGKAHRFMLEVGEHGVTCTIFDLDEDGKHIQCSCGLDETLRGLSALLVAAPKPK